MPAPLALTPYVKRLANPVLIHLAGWGWFVELVHVGRRSGTAYRTPLLAFRDGDVVTIALTYGPGVQWLKNIRAAGRSCMRHRDQVLELGAPVDLSTEEGLRRMPRLIRYVFARTGAVTDLIEMPVVAERPYRQG